MNNGGGPDYSILQPRWGYINYVVRRRCITAVVPKRKDVEVAACKSELQEAEDWQLSSVPVKI